MEVDTPDWQVEMRESLARPSLTMVARLIEYVACLETELDKLRGVNKLLSNNPMFRVVTSDELHYDDAADLQ